MTPPKNWAHDLAAGIAATFDWFDPPDVVDEPLLARALRHVAAECDELGYSLLLRSVADALDHPEASKRLRLGEAKPGRPNSGALFDRAMMVGPYVTKQVRLGVKKEAAVQQAMADFDLSRSAVMRSTSDYERYRLIFEPSQRDTKMRPTMREGLLDADEMQSRRLRKLNLVSKKAQD